MRDIKFRAFDKEKEEMWPAAELDFPGEKSYGSKFTIEDISTWLQDEYSFSLMQYTGIVDRKGKEIYEGDIVLVPYGRHKYNANYESYDTKTLDLIPCQIIYKKYGGFIPKLLIGNKTAQKRIGKRKCLWGIQPDDYEVIGNIYEHPHLLKENTNDQE